MDAEVIRALGHQIFMRVQERLGEVAKLLDMEGLGLIGLYWGNGKSNGHYYNVLGFYWDNGKVNGGHYSVLRFYSDNGKENGN